MKVVAMLSKLKTAYVSHLAVSLTLTAVAVAGVVGGVGYGVYSANKPAGDVTVAEEMDAPSLSTKERATTPSTKEDTVADTKVKEKKDTTKEEKKDATETTSSVEKKTEKKEDSSKTSTKSEAKATEEKATAENKSSASDHKVTASEENGSKASASENKSSSENKTSAPKSESPASKNETKNEAKTENKADNKTETAAHTHSWVHVAAVTRPITERKWVVDVPAWSEPITSEWEVIDKNTETMIIDGGICPPGSVVVGSHMESETTYMEHPEEGHWENVVVGEEVVTPAYDVCSGCGQRR